VENVLISVGSEHIGERIDVLISRSSHLDITRSMASKLCDQGLVFVDGAVVAKNFKIRGGGEEVNVLLPPPKPLEAVPQDISLDIVYEDDILLVVDKPKGMVVHPAAGNEDKTLVNALMHHCRSSLSGIGGVARPGIVHRIDKDTSGLLVVAKTDIAHDHLSRQLKEHSVIRLYHTVVYGRIDRDGVVNSPIGRHSLDRKKMAVTVKNSREAITHYRAHRSFDRFTYLICRLETGRTHQIRVHLSHIGHPVVGDIVYGPKKAITATNGQCLHAGTLGFVHPGSGQYMEFTSPLPKYFTDFISALKEYS